MIYHMDNFAAYGFDEGLMTDGLYAQVTNTQLAQDPLDSTQMCLHMRSGGTGASVLRYVYPGALQSSLGFAARYLFTSLPSQSDRIPVLWQVRNASNGALMSITVGTDGRLYVRDGDENDPSEGSTPEPVVIANAWQHLEFKVTNIDIIGGAAVEIKLEGTTVLSLSGLDLGAVQISQTAVSSVPDNTSGTAWFYIKDTIYWDMNGSYNTNFVGTLFVASLLPDEDVALNWALTGGANGADILDVVDPDDTAYISAIDPPPAAYRCSLTNLPTDVTSVKAAISYVRAWKVDGGDANLQVGMISGVTTGVGTNRAVTTAPVYWRDVFEVNPATSLPWIPADLDAANLQLNRTL